MRENPLGCHIPWVNPWIQLLEVGECFDSIFVRGELHLVEASHHRCLDFAFDPKVERQPHLYPCPVGLKGSGYIPRLNPVTCTTVDLSVVGLDAKGVEVVGGVGAVAFPAIGASDEVA